MRIVRVGGERGAAVEPGIETATDRMNDVCAPAQDRTVGDVCLDLKMFVPSCASGPRYKTPLLRSRKGPGRPAPRVRRAGGSASAVTSVPGARSEQARRPRRRAADRRGRGFPARPARVRAGRPTAAPRYVHAGPTRFQMTELER